MATRYWVGGNGTWDASTTTNWAATSGGSGGASAPTATDDVVFDTGSGGAATSYYFPTVTTGAACQNISISRVSSTLGVYFQGGALGLCSVSVSGNFSVLTDRCVFQQASSITVEFKFTATTPGKTISVFSGTTTLCSLTFDGAGGSWSLLSDVYTSTLDTVTLTRGELNLNSFGLAAFSFSSSNTNVRTITFGAAGWLGIYGTSSSSFNCATSTNLTISVGASSYITISANGGAGIKSFYGGGKTWPALRISDAFRVYGSNTFGSIGTVFNDGCSISFEQSTTQTFTTDIYMVGTAARNITLQSLSSGTQATISQASGLVFTGSYLNIKDSNATGGQSWTAYNSINSGNNTNWAFPVASKGSMMLFC